jgi:hypothetical protein
MLEKSTSSPRSTVKATRYLLESSFKPLSRSLGELSDRRNRCTRGKKRSVSRFVGGRKSHMKDEMEMSCLPNGADSVSSSCFSPPVTVQEEEVPQIPITGSDNTDSPYLDPKATRSYSYTFITFLFILVPVLAIAYWIKTERGRVLVGKIMGRKRAGAGYGRVAEGV